MGAIRFDSTSWLPGAVLFGNAGFGVRGDQIASSGTNGPGYAYNDLTLPADAAKEICGRITTMQTNGLLEDVLEDTSFKYTAFTNGSDFLLYQLYVDGVATGSPTPSYFTVGTVAAVITLTGANCTQANLSSSGSITISKSIVVPVAITPALLPLPDPADRATFSARKLEQMRWAANEYSIGSKALADAAYVNAQSSQSKSYEALVSLSAALTAASTASFTNFKGAWASQTGALSKPASVQHNGAFWALLNNVVNVAASQPGVTADWALIGGAFPIVPININTTAVPWITYLMYGACTLTLPAIAGSGQQVGVIVLADVTGAFIAPAGADKIRTVAGSIPVDPTPFDKILTDKGASYGWV